MKQPKGLGRGLDALLAGNEASGREQQRGLPITSLRPGKYQPRTRMDRESLEELAASIRAQGLMQPILVRPVGGGAGEECFEIIAGERRWRAAQLAGMSEVPALIREIPDESALAMALIENIQREDLNPLEVAHGLQRLIDEFSMTHQQVADAVGSSRPAASNLLRLLQLVPPVQELLMAGKIDMGHARALLPLPGDLQIQISQRVAQKRLSVREVERLARSALSNALKLPMETEAKPKPPDRDVLRLQEELSDALGARVLIRAGKKGAGRIQIEFGDLDQLDGILQRFR
ncbi:MAG: ParB/RepB/Spo0J family partition protein [Candidatus Accumulibacter sp.]|jgi:ParB family chromosome partitioning protein|nr:ParB/RepB/Spo0J family partition protein [Accumulibacter sp.]